MRAHQPAPGANDERLKIPVSSTKISPMQRQLRITPHLACSLRAKKLEMREISGEIVYIEHFRSLCRMQIEDPNVKLREPAKVSPDPARNPSRRLV